MKVEGIRDESYSYDQNGNRLAYQTDTANRLVSDGVYTYLYDGEGNRIQRKSIDSGLVTTYEWDYRNRLVGVTEGTKVIGYLYDATDRRIAKLLNGVVVESYGHDGDDLTVVSDAAGQVAQRYLFGGAIDEVLAEENASSVNWALADRLGSVDLIVDTQGAVVDRVTFDSFGNKAYDLAKAYDFRFGFTGRELDPETNQYYYRARYYDQGVGRFISTDPIGLEAGDTNLYRYVFNSPTQYTDPTGHEWDWGQAWNSFTNGVSQAWSATTQAIGDTVQSGANIATQVTAPIWNTAGSAINSIGSAYSDITKYGGQAVAGVFGETRDFYSNLLVQGQKEGGISGGFKQAVGYAGGTIISLPSAFTAPIGNTTRSAVNSIGSAYSDITKYGGQVSDDNGNGGLNDRIGGSPTRMAAKVSAQEK
jgi:RHS repeat-associated protein